MKLCQWALLLLGFVCVGCGSDQLPLQGSESNPITYVSFEVPEGWETESIQGFTYRGIKYDQPVDSFAHYIFIDVRIHPGTETDAAQLAEAYYNAHADEGATFSVEDVVGENLYLTELRTSDAYGGPWWASIAVFEKAGWVIELIMTDRVANQLEAIELLIQSITIEQTPADSNPQALALQIADSGVCQQITLDDIPVIESGLNWQMPEDSMRLTQHYNNQLVPGSDAYCLAPGTPSWDSPSCVGYTLYYGHDGIDLHRLGGGLGVDNVYAVADALVVASQSAGQNPGWGESIAIALRPNDYSEEILTFHYHHLHYDYTNQITSRQFVACDQVASGDVLGLVGNTGPTATHLHFTVRRWPNLQTLQTAIGSSAGDLFENGYSFGNDSYLEGGGYLDPLGLLYKTFIDYQLEENSNPPAYAWSLPFVLKMRNYGIEFGLYDGRYGAGEWVTRREAARWIKIAAAQESAAGVVNFLDVPASDDDYPYVQALAQYPGFEPVINPDHSCQIAAGQYFCPDNNVNRAEALKMIILGFYHEGFLPLYNNIFWKGTISIVGDLLANFEDVEPTDWFAPYVYYGTVLGFVANNQYFNPGDPVTREEMAKWIVLGYEHLNGAESNQCTSVLCPENNYCDPEDGTCHEIPACVPSGGVDCPVGGGIDTCENPDCSPGETQDQACGINGTQSATCTQQCQWGPWGTCDDNASCTPQEQQGCGNCGTMTCDTQGQWGSCLSQGVCSPGTTQDQTCNSVGTQSRSCSNGCSWGSWGACSAACYPGQTQQQSCDGGTGTQERSCNGSGQWGSWGSCVPDCQDVYLSSAASACYGNPQGSGNPTLCLYAQQNSGSSWKYQICKQGSAFQNNFTYKLIDENHDVIFPQYSASPTTCTTWRNFDVSYIPGYGPANGAGVVGHLASPSGCVEPACQYKTGVITIRRECQ